MTSAPTTRPAGRGITGTAGMPRQRLDLSKAVSRNSGNIPPRILINGGGGIGKTSLATKIKAKGKDSLFLCSPGETGLLTLQDNGLADKDIDHFVWQGEDGRQIDYAQTWDDIVAAVDALIHQEHNYGTIVFDVLNGIEKLCQEWTCKTHFNGNWGNDGFSSYQKGYELSMFEFVNFIQMLNVLRERKKVYIIGLCHTKLQKISNPDGVDYDKWLPDMHWKVWSYVYQWADVCLYCNTELFVEKEKGSQKGKAHGGTTRWMNVSECSTFDAKNRHGLTGKISMGNSADEAWANLRGEMMAAKKANLSANQSNGQSEQSAS